METDNIRKVQLEELNMLKKLDKILKENNFKYFALGGTVLGTIRHNGFIPWDDDIDIGLFRKDFEKMEEIIEKILPEDFKYFSVKNNSIKKGPIGKFYYVKNKDKNIYNMPSIDIFPLDNVPDNIILEKIQNIFSKIYHLSICKRIALNRGKINYLLTKFILCIIPKFCLDYLAKISKKIITLWNDKDTLYINNIYGANYEKVPQKCFLYLEKRKFEDFQILVPKDYDTYLTILYKDYMTFPPEEKRKPKHKEL